MKNIAIISFTERGRLLSRRMAGALSDFYVKRFCFHTHADGDAESFFDTMSLTERLFKDCDALVFVSACGIAVRAVAGFISSKQTDPAVIVADDCGSFIIPILSGHLGGANELARLIANKLGAQAVVTTATDTGGRFSPDSFAAANDLLIDDLTAAKEIASAVLDGERVGVLCEYEHVNMPTELCGDTDCRAGIYIGSAELTPFEITLKLIPKNVVLGLGCRRGTPLQAIENAVKVALDSRGISFARVCAVASIDIKADEEGLLEFCKGHGLELYTYSAKELSAVNGDFTASDFVRKATGVDNVCERSAVKCSGGQLIMGKIAAEGVTVAAAEKPVLIDFERTML